MPLKSIISNPWLGKEFNLDSSGVAGFFGGEEAISAMTTVHLYRGRRWLGWYNSPGGYTVAKYYGRIAKGSLWTGLYPGPKMDPVELFELGGKKNPRFVAAHSGTLLQETGHLGYLLLKKCESLKHEDVQGDRQTTPTGVTVVNLDEPHELMLNGSPTTNSDPHSPLATNSPPTPPAASSPPLLYPAIPDVPVVLTSIIPILSSIGTCVISGLATDWYAFSMILLGIVANGLTCLVLGSGILTVKRVKPADDAPPGDGLLETKRETVVLRGPESAIAQVTRASFALQFSTTISAPNYHDVGVCCVLLTGQFLLQLLLIPQATLFGQTMFLISFAVSWLYNAYLSSFDKEEMQRKVLLSRDDVLKINGQLKRYQFGTRTAMAVFVMFALQPKNPRYILDHLIPNDTDIWNTFKEKVAEQVKFRGDVLLIDLKLGHEVEGDRTLAKNLVADARRAYQTYRDYLKFRENEVAEIKLKEKEEV